MLVCDECGTGTGSSPVTNSTIAHDSTPVVQQRLDPEFELAELDSDIAKVEEHLAHLVRKRSPLKIKINDLKSPFIRALPHEIISHIFTFYVPLFSQFQPKTPKASTNALELGAICKTWRDIAWTTPELWSSVSLHLAFSKIHILTELIEQWLLRSGQLPLSIRLYCSAGDDWKLSDQLTLSLINVINRYSSRWRELELRIPTIFFEGFRGNENQISILEALHLDPPDGQTDRTQKFELPHSPSLGRVHISSVYLKAVNVQWEQVTRVYASAFYMDECIEILKRCPHLIHCDFPSIINGDDDYSLPETPFLVPSLQRLLLHNDGPEIPTALLNKIIAPSLEELVFDVGGRVLKADDLISFLDRSACSLQRLALSRADVAHDQLLRFYERTPTLKRLSLSTSEGLSLSLTDNILNLLRSGCANSPGSGSPARLLPELEIFEYSGNQTFAWKSIVDIICCAPTTTTQTRGQAPSDMPKTPTDFLVMPTPHHHTLHKVTINLARQENAVIDKDTLSQMVQLVEEGFCLEIKYNSSDLIHASLHGHGVDDLECYLALRQRYSNAGVHVEV